MGPCVLLLEQSLREHVDERQPLRLQQNTKSSSLISEKDNYSGKRSGGGRVVTTLYDECPEIWSGSSAVDSMRSGQESSFETAYVSDSEENVASGSFTATDNKDKQGWKY
ncbi:hypothetical protein ACROYT_G007128 [Oculina patagonica]